MINMFSGKYEWLSNFCPSEIVINNKVYRTVEHFYQASKAINEQDHERIRNAPKPGNAKWIGKHILLREDWNTIQIPLMELAIIHKFAIPSFRKLLVATDSQELIEGNYWHDNFWGNCLCHRCDNIPGKNNLGKIIMDIRKYIINHQI